MALAVLGVVLVAVLGWFLAIRPQFSATSDAASEADAIRANTQLIEASSNQLNNYQALLAEDDTTAPAIELNAPSRLDMSTFRDRISRVVDSSGVGLVSFAQVDGRAVDGWELEPSALVSNQVANLFSTGPVAGAVAQNDAVATTDGEAVAPAGAWTPVVTPVTEVGPVAGDIRMVEIQMEVVGTASEVDGFLRALMNADEQLFQVYDVEQTGGGGGEPIGDRSEGADDLGVIVYGALYVHSADLSIVDEETLGSATPSDSAFASN
ncbi:hypothetical protein [Demequina lignilytica]|uniref:Type II secretion system (T2SS), protein M subtype b n=1 Tax=Demequina lignilytica TaxID=3051663 RepID=A0AB35ME51_9MICO|nr:hypothetical protein [Demequina sp. SYSU T0a273]MDN4482047.1 hypothetical protein [Demequina sp. SYSU T0a273]